MPWNETDREKYAVTRTRYASDVSDAEFALIEPLPPARKSRGRKPTDARTTLRALFYMVRTSCPWRYLPKDFPPFTTVQARFRVARQRSVGADRQRAGYDRSRSGGEKGGADGRHRLTASRSKLPNNPISRYHHWLRDNRPARRTELDADYRKARSNSCCTAE